MIGKSTLDFQISDSERTELCDFLATLVKEQPAPIFYPKYSPVGKTPYNGAIKHAEGEVKTYLSRWTDKANTVEEFALLADIAAHDLNHKVRRALSGKTACQSYFNENRMRDTPNASEKAPIVGSEILRLTSL